MYKRQAPEDSKIDWDDVVFEIDLLKSQEIDLDYIPVSYTHLPNGVEEKRLGDIATVSRGGNFQKKDYVEDGVPCIGLLYTSRWV